MYCTTSLHEHDKTTLRSSGSTVRRQQQQDGLDSPSPALPFNLDKPLIS